VIGDPAVVTEVGEGHDEIVVADARRAAALDGAEADADVFADAIAVADDERRVARGEAVILRRPAEDGAALDQISGADADAPVSAADTRVRLDDGLGADADASFDDAERPDLGRRCDLGIRRYDRGGVNTHAGLSL